MAVAKLLDKATSSFCDEASVPVGSSLMTTRIARKRYHESRKAVNVMIWRPEFRGFGSARVQFSRNFSQIVVGTVNIASPAGRGSYPLFLS